jgi:hypothetical protein
LNSATWIGGVIPGPTSPVVIGVGHDVTLDGMGEAGVLCIEGRLAFAPGANTRMTVGTMMIARAADRLKSARRPRPSRPTRRREIVIANVPLNDAALPSRPGQDR